MQPLSDENIPKHAGFDPVILREYDIRGQIGKNLSAAEAYLLGQSFGSFVRRRGGSHICVGYDGRLSSPDMSDALIKGLTSVGINVTNVGLGPTPMLYFSVKHLKADAGVMVTGSHNPPDYNGFKMTLYNEPVFGDTIQELGQIAQRQDFEGAQFPGEVKSHDIRQDYIKRLMQDYACERNLKVAWDVGNGAAGETMRLLAAALPGEHILLFDEIDGTFPNHHPDPTVDSNLVDLIKVVKDQKCDLGIAFDGDGDRIGVVDENGDVLRCDILMTIYAKEVLENQPGAPIVGDVKCSNVMFDEIERLGGIPVMWKTGHSLVKDKMRALESPLGGELSGHIFFADKYYGFDDALYCGVRLLNALSDVTGGLSSLTKDLPKLVSTPEIRFEVDETEKFDLVPCVAESLRAQDLEGFEIDDIDGIRVNSRDGWWLLRPSNTQNVLVARVEAQDKDSLNTLLTMLRREVEKIGYSIPL